MGNDLNYKSLYLTNYKKLPIYFFYGTLIFLAIDSVIAGIAIFIQNDYFWVLLLTILGGWLISLGIALYVYWMSSVIISQRVVVADTLLAMHENKESGSSSTKEQNVVSQDTMSKDNIPQNTIFPKNIIKESVSSRMKVQSNVQKNTIIKDGGWMCTCGLTNPKNYSICSCGKTKREALSSQNLNQDNR